MKKLFTIIIVLFLSTYLNAQDFWPPSNLIAEGDFGVIHLSWDAPTDPNAMVEGFESGQIPIDWGNVDNDGDEYTWDVWDLFVHSGTYAAASFSYINNVGAVVPDNWLITPSAQMGPGGLLTFWAGASDPSWYWEQFQVYVSTTGNTPTDFTDPPLLDVTLDAPAAGAFVQYSVDLSAFDGQTIWIAFVHFGSTDVFNLTLDDISLSGAVGPAAWNITFEDPNDIKRFSQYAVTESGVYPIRISESDNPNFIKEKIEKYMSAQNSKPKPDKAPDGYNVYRDDSLIGSTGDTFFDDDGMTYGEPHDYYVTAVYGTDESEPTNTATATAMDPGNIIACYDFEDGTAPLDFTVLNNNDDEYTWEVTDIDGNAGSTYSWAIRWNSNMPMDDYTFIGPFNLDEAGYFALEFFRKVASATYPENLAGGIYSATDPTALVSQLFDFIGMTEETWTPEQFIFSVPASGDYYIGFWAHSDADTWRIYLDDICIKYSEQIPVELTSFTANVIDGDVVLNWQTATETNNSGFAVERSSDNQKFEEIAFVGGNGTTAEKSSYNFIDSQAPSGNLFYRLKQMDFDGSYEYSPVVEIEVNTPKEFALAQNYPNPFNPSTQISFALPVDSKVTITLYNAIGQAIRTLANNDFSAGIHKLDFVANELSTGVYIYTIKAQGVDGSNFISSRKMILMK